MAQKRPSSRIGWAVLMALPCSARIAYADAPSAAIKSNAPEYPQFQYHEFQYHQPNLLGTTLDLTLIAPSQAVADACQQTILNEVERLRRILSTYDPDSEISQFEANRSTAPIAVSPDLHEVLSGYVHWHNVSAAYSLQLGDLLQLWNDAENRGTPPTDFQIAPLLEKSRQAALTIVSDTAVRKLSDQRLNIDSAGKGYIVQKAAAVAKSAHPLVTGILLNIGGDITAIGAASPPGELPPRPWNISIADPQNASDNAPAATSLAVTNKSVATSGTYERYYTFAGQKFSHILNPLTGRPSTNDVLSATVIAGENLTANALATTLCVLPPAEGIKLIENTPGAAAFLIMNGGKQIESSGFAAYKLPPRSAPIAEAATTAPADGTPTAPTTAAANWPKNFVLSVDLNELPFPPRPDYIPYSTAWIENPSGHCVKILAAWIGDKHYLRSMRRFPAACRTSPDFAAMTRATRRVGRYTISWDGTDASNNAMPQGQYFLCLEVCCEHGGRSTAKQAITCGDSASSVTVPGALLWKPIAVSYGPHPSQQTSRTDGQ